MPTSIEGNRKKKMWGLKLRRKSSTSAVDQLPSESPFHLLEKPFAQVDSPTTASSIDDSSPRAMLSRKKNIFDTSSDSETSSDELGFDSQSDTNSEDLTESVELFLNQMNNIIAEQCN
jgi:hypothetical protein